MDPLSELLSLLKPQSYVSGGVTIRANMAIQWPPHIGIKCYAVVSGQCWLSVEGIAEPVLLTAGDCYLLPPGPAFCLATDPLAKPVDFTVVRDALRRGDEANVEDDGGDNCMLAGGHFVLTGRHADMLLGSLPVIVHIKKEADKAAMRWSIERMVAEIRYPQPGGALITQQLAYMMLVQALRLHLSDRSKKDSGWLFALVDKPLCAAISGIHDEPGYPWTLQQLARRAGMSRSTFAQRFKDVIATTPIEYLTRWRMLLACEKLTSSSDSVYLIATSLGYESESAFSKAFKRVIGQTPGQHRRASILNHHGNVV
ncbi:AraC family transcriptional regulator [Providencia burhodogranariea]|uniref:AraC family transcriptional regulator n=1 Tax=Providencia burhodogranariea DSM 19968 TaxID=1141662 RepID=K8WRN1_9GAMM|nr:AraC family transcriptional regulator [Providencia burhodogranariea]EKT63284.1 AraC family transcriptional regulator [Providencia burhodogranariea DSM 19968]